MSPESAGVLHAAAVIGDRFELDVLAHVVGRHQLECLDLLAEAAQLGIVERDGGPRRHRFVDAAVRAALFDGLSASEQVRLHAAVAEAIGTIHAERIDSHLFELAAHWSAAAVGDYRGPAATWVARAADAAAAQGAHEKAATLYRRALDIRGAVLDSNEHCRLLLGAARATYRCSDVDAALSACRKASSVAQHIPRPDVLAAAALVVEPTLVPEVNAGLRRLCESALLAVEDDMALRTRLTARLADICHYLGDHEAAATACDQLNELLDVCDDPPAEGLALHALQLDASGPSGLARRADLANRLHALAAEMGDINEVTWARLWLIDVALQQGDLAGAGAEIAAASQATADLADVVTRWHLLRAQATLAQAQARFADASRLADEAGTVLASSGNPLGQIIRVGQLVNIHLQTGVDPPVAAALGLDVAHPPTPVGALDTLSSALVLLRLERRAEAAAAYRSLGPVPEWRCAPHGELFALAYGIRAAAELGETDDVAELARRLAAHRGLHVASGAGCVAYCGPVELWLGVAAGHLGDHDAAVADLEYAIAACAANGAAGFLVEARLELARVLHSRAGRADLDTARSLAASAADRAELLGMRPFAAAARSLLARSDASAGGLTRREREVAELVATGLTNRAIAARLYLSERTVANHVQHVLQKLGLSNRSQVAAWVSGNRLST